MEPERSLPHSQVPATCPYPEADQFSLCPTSHFLKILLKTNFQSMAVSSKWPLSFRCLHQNPIYTSPLPKRAKCPAHLIIFDLITRMILGDEYR